MNTPLPYFLGCPVWACPHWTGSLFASGNRQTWLRDYSAVFNTVEGNSTFYGLPSLDTARRWGESVADGFRFALKFPRDISHDLRLKGAERHTAMFLEYLEILDRFDCLGPSFLQLPPTYSGEDFGRLETYLRSLPTEYPFAVEVRHSDYFDAKQSIEHELDALLSELNIDRVLFDSRPLFSKPPTDEIERESQRRKPQSPYRRNVTGSRPMLRLVGRNNLDEAMPWVVEWAPVIGGWINGGLQPFIFAHSPDDTFAPKFAERLHEEIRLHVADLPPLPEWPGRRRPNEVQQSLF